MSERKPARGDAPGPRRRTTGAPRTGAPRSGAPQRGNAPQRGSSGTTKPSQPTRLPPQREKPTVAVDVHDPDGVRLQKLLAAAGVGSRRACELSLIHI